MRKVSCDAPERQQAAWPRIPTGASRLMFALATGGIETHFIFWILNKCLLPKTCRTVSKMSTSNSLGIFAGNFSSIMFVEELQFNEKLLSSSAFVLVCLFVFVLVWFDFLIIRKFKIWKRTLCFPGQSLKPSVIQLCFFWWFWSGSDKLISSLKVKFSAGPSEGSLILMMFLQGYISQDLILHINADRRQSTSEHLTCPSCFMLGFSAVAWSDKSLYKSNPRQVVCLPVVLTQLI